MQQIREAIRQMIRVSDAELDQLLSYCSIQHFKRKSLLSQANEIPQEIFFINQGIIRTTIEDRDGREHTLHFALENQFIADYSSFLLHQPAIYNLVAIEETEAVIMPRAAIEWGYQHMADGNKLGRTIAEYYFVYQDHRIKNFYARTPKERYDEIDHIFPNIHNRVPQHMIASYLGITPVHLSRLKKEDR
ncbi:MAG: Crp/Fnr family transcriptional regulator [Bacteroidota bacterium]